MVDDRRDLHSERHTTPKHTTRQHLPRAQATRTIRASSASSDQQAPLLPPTVWDAKDWVSTRRAQELLAEKVGVPVSRETIRKACNRRRHRFEGRVNDNFPRNPELADDDPAQRPGELICTWTYPKDEQTGGAGWYTVVYSIYAPSLDRLELNIRIGEKNRSRGWPLGKKRGPRAKPPQEGPDSEQE